MNLTLATIKDGRLVCDGALIETAEGTWSSFGATRDGINAKTDMFLEGMTIGQALDWAINLYGVNSIVVQATEQLEQSIKQARLHHDKPIVSYTVDPSVGHPAYKEDEI